MTVLSKIDEGFAKEWKLICPEADTNSFGTAITSTAAQHAMSTADDAEDIGLKSHLLGSFDAALLDAIKTDDWQKFLSMKPGTAIALGSKLVGQIVDGLKLTPTGPAAEGAAPAAPSETDKALLKSLKAFLCAGIDQCVLRS